MVIRSAPKRNSGRRDEEWKTRSAIPEEIVRQLDYFVSCLCEIEAENLVGIYLHGSFAMGCFQPQHSDLDLLVLIAHPAPPPHIRAWAQQTLQSSSAPSPIELSVLHHSQYTPWRHPTPFSFHFSEKWRPAIIQTLADEAWQQWEPSEKRDPDLAAHFMVTRRRGACLAGASVESAVPQVPWKDFLDSILGDFTWAYARAEDNPVYLVLNSCRIWAAVVEGRILSKAEGAVWALSRLPADLRPVVTSAAALYGSKMGSIRSRSTADSITSADARALACWIAQYLPIQKEGPAIA